MNHYKQIITNIVVRAQVTSQLERFDVLFIIILSSKIKINDFQIQAKFSNTTTNSTTLTTHITSLERDSKKRKTRTTLSREKRIKIAMFFAIASHQKIFITSWTKFCNLLHVRFVACRESLDVEQFVFDIHWKCALENDARSERRIIASRDFEVSVVEIDQRLKTFETSAHLLLS